MNLTPAITGSTTPFLIVLSLLVGGAVGYGVASSTQNHVVEKAVVSEIGPLTPRLATEFVEWWSKKAFDFDSKKFLKHHNEAAAWMIDDSTRKRFAEIFWAPQFESKKLHDYGWQHCSHEIVSVNGNFGLVKSTGYLVSFSDPCELKEVTIVFAVEVEHDGYRITDFEIQNDPEGEGLKAFIGKTPLR